MKVAHQFLLAPTQTGAITAASTRLAAHMVNEVPLENCKTVVEFGPGTGVVTEVISQSLVPDTTFFALELNRSFAEKTRARCPGVTVYQDNALELAKYLARHDVTQCDAIISSLPWTLFSSSVQEAILDTIKSTLAPGGTFVTYSYMGTEILPAGRRFVQLMNDRFKHSEKKVVWSVLPPTKVFRCKVPPEINQKVTPIASKTKLARPAYIPAEKRAG